MDVLYFLKEEYAAVKETLSGLFGSEAQVLTESELRPYLKQVELVIRVSEELILPELADSTTRGLEALAEAGNQSSDLAKIVHSGLKSGRLGEARKRDLAARLLSHIEHMEQVILPMFRVEIPTQAREELGLVALDFKVEVFSASKVSMVQEVAV